MKKLLVVICALLFVIPARAQEKTDKKLTQQLQELVKGFHGDIGIYVKNLKTGKTAQVNADTLFPTASMIKVSIQCGMMDKIEKGELKYGQPLGYRDSLKYAGSDILGSFKDRDTIELSKVAMLMITMSDNTAALWIQKLVTGQYINNWLQQNGFQNTRVNSRVPGREAIRKQYGWGVTTPHEMCSLFTLIRDGKAVSPAASERMYRNLIRIYWDGQALSQIPPYVQVASKSGAVNDSRSETLLVNAPHGDYVFSVITKNQKDQSWNHNNEAYVLIRNLSALLYHYYEPKDNWQPAVGGEKYW
jgi:beta-lactamase class A